MPWNGTKPYWYYYRCRTCFWWCIIVERWRMKDRLWKLPFLVRKNISHHGSVVYKLQRWYYDHKTFSSKNDVNSKPRSSYMRSWTGVMRSTEHALRSMRQQRALYLLFIAKIQAMLVRLEIARSTETIQSGRSAAKESQTTKYPNASSTIVKFAFSRKFFSLHSRRVNARKRNSFRCCFIHSAIETLGRCRYPWVSCSVPPESIARTFGVKNMSLERYSSCSVPCSFDTSAV